MSAKKSLLMGTAIVALSAMAAAKAKAASGTGPMSASILQAITISGTQVLNFGQLTQTGAGTATIDTAGGRTTGGGVNAAGGTVQAGVLLITGASGVPIQVSMAAATYTVDDAGAGAPMNVNGWNLRTAAGGATETVTLPGAGTTTVPLGATLNVGAAQTTGTYTGNYTVNANYQ